MYQSELKHKPKCAKTCITWHNVLTSAMYISTKLCKTVLNWKKWNQTTSTYKVIIHNCGIIPISTKLYQPVLYKPYQPVSKCTNLYQTVPTCTNTHYSTKLYKTVPLFTKLYQPVPKCTDLAPGQCGGIPTWVKYTRSRHQFDMRQTWSRHEADTKQVSGTKWTPGTHMRA